MEFTPFNLETPKGKGGKSIKSSNYVDEHLDEVGDFYEEIFDEQRLVNAEYEDYLDELVKLDKESLDDIEVVKN